MMSFILSLLLIKDYISHIKGYLLSVLTPSIFSSQVCGQGVWRSHRLGKFSHVLRIHHIHPPDLTTAILLEWWQFGPFHQYFKFPLDLSRDLGSYFNRNMTNIFQILIIIDSSQDHKLSIVILMFSVCEIEV